MLSTDCIAKLPRPLQCIHRSKHVRTEADVYPKKRALLRTQSQRSHLQQMVSNAPDQVSVHYRVFQEFSGCSVCMFTRFKRQLPALMLKVTSLFTHPHHGTSMAASRNRKSDCLHLPHPGDGRNQETRQKYKGSHKCSFKVYSSYAKDCKHMELIYLTLS